MPSAEPPEARVRGPLQRDRPRDAPGAAAALAHGGRCGARTSIAITRANDARRAEVRRILDRWDLLLAQTAEIEARLAELVAQHPGANALTTVPAIGVLCAATLVAEIGTPESFESPRQVLKLAGMNLARKESGTSLRGRVRQTKCGRPLLRRQLFLLAGRWCQPGGLYREEYQAMVARNGGRKIAARCVIARRLVGAAAGGRHDAGPAAGPGRALA